jgi:hypothetical protein
MSGLIRICNMNWLERWHSGWNVELLFPALCRALVARGESVGGGMKFDDSLVLDGSLTRAYTNIVLQI